MNDLVLTGEQVVLEPLSMDHVDDLVVAAVEHRPVCTYTEVPSTPVEVERYVSRMLKQKGCMPFAQRRIADGRVVGCTAYFQPIWWRGRFEPDEVEIGGTWLDRTAQRTAINTEAKALLLTHAFERWAVWRVNVLIDERNEVSRRAIERIGATFEGVLRNHQMSHHPDEAGRPRNTAMYSIIDGEWPAVKSHLAELLAHPTRTR
jgi:RimJ/RimL family protein N-acetyltransferase